MSRLLLSSGELWERHERRCLEVLIGALLRFRLDRTDESEGELNRRFYLCLLEAARDIERRDDVELPVVVPEGQNPPLLSDQARAAREFKRPDFYWAYHDHDGPEPARQFVVECKRLTPASRRWVYTDQYVEAGIARYTSEAHGYGKAAPSGAMVGYVQTLGVGTAEAHVNAALETSGLPRLGRSPAPSGLSAFTHDLQRTFPHSPFRLRHFWSAGAGAHAGSRGTAAAEP